MRFRASLILAAAVALAACQYSPDTARRTISYNQGIAQSTNDLFLLNAVRASERMPTYYTRNQSNTTTSTVAPGVSLSGALNASPMATSTFGTGATALAAGPGATQFVYSVTRAATSINPSLSATDTNQLNLTNLDDQASMNGLLSPVSLQEIQNYLLERFSPEEMYLLYIDHIDMSRAVLDSLLNAAAEHCAVNRISRGSSASGSGLYCTYLFGAGMPTKYRYEFLPGGAVRLITSPLSNDAAATESFPDPERSARTYIDNSRLRDGLTFYKFTRDDLKTAGGGSVITPNCFHDSTIDNSASPLQTIVRYQQFKWPYYPQAPASEHRARSGRRHRAPITEAPARPSRQSASYYMDYVAALDFSPSARLRTRDPTEMVTFVNDPALDFEPQDSSLGQLRSFSCFQQVLRVLLALDLGPADDPSKALYRLSQSLLAQNPRYIADLTQQKLVFAVPKDKKATGEAAKKTDGESDDETSGAVLAGPKIKGPSFGVCQKSDGKHLAPANDDYVDDLLGLAMKDPSVGASITRADKAEKKTKGPDDTADTPVPLATQLSDPTPGGCASLVADWGKPPPGDASFVTVSPRSLESIVYFLGEIVRRDVLDTEDCTRGEGLDIRVCNNRPTRVSATILNWRAPSGPPVTLEGPPTPGASTNGYTYIYEEELFRVAEGIPTLDAIARTSDGLSHYFVPRMCDAKLGLYTMHPPDPCTRETPDHASGEVLTVVNQLWGLNKTVATAPAIAPVTVVTH